jgi:excisionase family DNA binding protein
MSSIKSTDVPRILYTVEETAAALGIGVTKTKELISSREIRSLKIGRLRRIPLSAVNEYIVLRDMAEDSGGDE